MDDFKYRGIVWLSQPSFRIEQQLHYLHEQSGLSCIRRCKKQLGEKLTDFRVRMAKPSNRGDGSGFQRLSNHWGENMSAIYCLFCKPGSEQQVHKHLQRLGYRSLIPYTERVIVRNEKRMNEKRKLFPGYVFVRDNPLTEDQLKEIAAIEQVIRPLRYSNGQSMLVPEDASLVEWLWKREGMFEVSQVYKVGSRIRVLSGPLKEFEASIVKVNLKRNSVAIQLDGNSMLGRIWCSVELIELTENSIALGNDSIRI